MLAASLAVALAVGAVTAPVPDPLDCTPHGGGEYRLAEPPIGLGARNEPIANGLYAEPGDLDALTAWLPAPASLLGTFAAFDDEVSRASLPATLSDLWARGATPLLNLEARHHSAAAIAAGEADAELTAVFTDIAAWAAGGRRLLLAFLQEPNGSWSPYGVDPSGFRTAWARARTLAWDAGLRGDTVRWVFAPHGWSEAPYRIADYYPGDTLVDFIGLTTYNWGESDWNTNNTHWENFDCTVRVYLEEVLATVSASKPVLIAQLGSTTLGGDREAWIAEAYARLVAYPQVRGVLWFNIHKETDWPVFDPARGVASVAYRTAVSAPSYAYTFPLAWFTAPGEAWTFLDVRPADPLGGGHPYHAFVEAVAAAGLVAGVAAVPPLYGPDQVLTRAQGAVMLAGVLAAAIEPVADAFADDTGHYAEIALNNLAARGAVVGCAAGLACPDAPLTRGQMAVILWNVFAPGVAPAGPDAFVDDTAHFAEASLDALAAAGLVAGCAPGRACPDNALTRGEAAVLLARLLASR